MKDIVTENGTEFKQGMISGGIHQNIFNVSFGTTRLDNEWKNLFKEIKTIDEELQILRQQEKDDNHMQELQREVAEAETEVETLKMRIKEQERLMADSVETNKELTH